MFSCFNEPVGVGELVISPEMMFIHPLFWFYKDRFCSNGPSGSIFNFENFDILKKSKISKKYRKSRNLENRKSENQDFQIFQNTFFFEIFFEPLEQLEQNLSLQNQNIGCINTISGEIINSPTPTGSLKQENI